MSNDMHGANATGDDQAAGGRREAPQAAQVAAELQYNSELAEANLLRMRGKWDEAIKKCVAILRQRPHDAVVHSLVGDIYRDQGRMDEAAQWYQMALDIDPNSVGDRAKLGRLLATAQPKPQAGERWTLPLVLAVVCLSLLVVAGMLAMAGGRRARWQRAPAAPSPTAPPGLVRHGPAARPFAAPTAPTRPTVAPPAATQPTAAAPEVHQESPDAHSALELHLAQAIAQGMRQEVQGPVSVRSVILDPRTHSGIITLYRATVPRGQDSAEIIQGEACTAGMWLLTLAPDIQRATVRVLARFYPQAVSTAGAELVFVGDLARSTSQSRFASASMTDQWWHPRLAAVAPTPAQPATSGLVPRPFP
jgi:hypothetical protein